MGLRNEISVLEEAFERVRQGDSDALAHLPARFEIRANLEYTGTASLDHGKMRRVIVNIAGNARDAMVANGGSFTISSRLEDEYIRLDLTDDGPGIPKEILSTIFEPFVTQGKSHGTGLSLAISKKIVEDHGETIEVISGVDQGAHFVIRLPQP